MFSIENKVCNRNEAKFLTYRAYCPHTSGYNAVRRSHLDRTRCCKDCRKFDFKGTLFGVRTGTVQEYAKLTHRELGISQKSAWPMLHRPQNAAETANVIFSSVMEVDEIYASRKRKNTSEAQRRRTKITGVGDLGTAAVVGVNNQICGQDSAEVVDNTDNTILRNLVVRHIQGEAKVHTSKAKAHTDLPFVLESVRYGQNKREMGTVEQMSCIVTCIQGKWLKYAELAR